MTSTVPETRAEQGRTRRRGLVAASIGNALEWFDWNSFAIFSAFFAPQFFAKGDPAVALLSALAIFAVGFFFRPLGGALLAAFADRRGRRAGLTLSVVLMAGGSLLIAVSPTYEQVGLLAPVLLLLARIAQGLSTGGEFAASSTYLAELAPPGRRGFYASFLYLSTTLGTVLSTLLATVLTGTLGKAAVAEWAWRIPFAIGALLGVYGLYLRRTLEETEAYTEGRGRRVSRPTLELLRKHPLGALRVVGFTVGATTAYYTFAVYLPNYAQKEHAVPTSSALWASVAAQLVMMGVLPLLGALSDRVGRRPLLITFAVGFVVLVVPLFALLDSSAFTLFAVMTVGLALFSCYGAVAPAAMAELFPTEVRAAGVGLPYALTVALFGGTAPYVVEWLAAQGRGGLYPWYLSLLCLVSLVVYLRGKETRDADLVRVDKG
ncbi:MFS transporter, MHS family, alpha-ketoglutarate permease [Streptoalloteichus tenebrarius]|uniref:MFS transporter, MHS family, alpha-ketoglutarate permease n=1 Tax=Streptoalloteichus tenebrarius (strain ATCC 17920 / DSM 40477 / JCM 4838 / CBS 697.72 / NBRC 16177 / NCIMB 11028 / NRRL B-12390 / A12253. 1 / ISP 5477) TaxID=1933 RepID=A0ABT1HSG1_STRSD|nr:MFS transporter [Streptoalloteichus tenebrarius]MCP2258460.1 MFS transporter, MHS family, alpha-ketoglutarate permease [Streptoalloteichus tenebrarius]BFF03632.1 MFS transporter [Streptoalloteichus tenebrarius]